MRLIMLKYFTKDVPDFRGAMKLILVEGGTYDFDNESFAQDLINGGYAKNE